MNKVILLKIFYFLSITLTALSTGLSFAHLLELPPKVYYFDAQLWIAVTTGGLYYLFGLIGGPIEVSSVISTFLLVFILWRNQEKSWRFVLTGAICISLALTLWFLLIYPVNAELAKWTTNDFPADWTRWRNRWEYAHAANALVKLVGLSSLIWSLVNPNNLTNDCAAKNYK